MKLNEYQRLASRTINLRLTKQEKVTHALHGMWSEYGEIRGIFQKRYQGHIEKDNVHLKKECGDLFWFLCEMATANNLEFDDSTVLLGSTYHGEEPHKYAHDLAMDLFRLEDQIDTEKLTRRNLSFAFNSLVCFCLSMDIDYEDALQMNIDKLIARYPEGFEAEKSLHRAKGDI